MADRVLVVGSSWVGDMVMSQVLYRVLGQRYPETSIDVLAPSASIPLVTRMAEVSRGIHFKLAHGELGLKKRLAMGERLKQNAYRQAIVLPNSMKSALVPFFANIPVRTGFRGEYRYFLLNDMRLLNQRIMPRMIDRFAVLGVAPGKNVPVLEYPQLIIDKARRRELVTKLQLLPGKEVLGLCPGAEYGGAKQWPAAYFARLALEAMSRGMQVWVFGSSKDKETAAKIVNLVEVRSKEKINKDFSANSVAIRDLTGKTSLLDVVDLLSLCHLVVSNDSGLMHIAAAVGCRTAVVYGSSSPVLTPPLTDKLNVYFLGLPCSPCFKRQCPLQHKNCLKQLPPERLIPLLDE